MDSKEPISEKYSKPSDLGAAKAVLKKHGLGSVLNHYYDHSHDFAIMGCANIVSNILRLRRELSKKQKCFNEAYNDTGHNEPKVMPKQLLEKLKKLTSDIEVSTTKSVRISKRSSGNVTPNARKFTLHLLSGVNPSGLICVYKIRIGGKFYVGTTTDLAKRIDAHESSIVWALCNHGKYRSSLMEDANGRKKVKMEMYRNFTSHIMDNPSIKQGYVQILHWCKDWKSAFIKEQYELSLLENNSDCLNVKVRTKIPSRFNPVKFSIHKRYTK